MSIIPSSIAQAHTIFVIWRLVWIGGGIEKDIKNKSMKIMEFKLVYEIKQPKAYIYLCIKCHSSYSACIVVYANNNN